MTAAFDIRLICDRCHRVLSMPVPQASMVYPAQAASWARGEAYRAGWALRRTPGGTLRDHCEECR